MNFGEIIKVLIKILILNWLVAGAKIVLGILTGALSITADGLHSLFDGATNIIGIFGIKVAKKPADECHPYGHLKYEAIAATFILGFLIFTILEIGKEIIERFKNFQQPEISWLFIGVLGVCILIDFLVARYEYRKGRELKSTILVADSQHTKSHYITTGAVILGAVLIKLGVPPIIDPLIAIVVVGFIGHLVWDVFKEISPVLSDKAVIEAERIEEIVNAVDGVKSCHKIRSRGHETHVFVDIHIVLDQNLTLGETHQICSLIEEKIRAEILEIKDITIHPEPDGVCLQVIEAILRKKFKPTK